MGIEILPRSRVLARSVDPWMDAFKLEVTLCDEKFDLLIVLDGITSIPHDLETCLAELDHAVVAQCAELSTLVGRQARPVCPPDGILYVGGATCEAKRLDLLEKRFPRSPCLIWGIAEPLGRRSGSKDHGFQPSSEKSHRLLITLMRTRLRLLRSRDREHGAAPISSALYERLTCLTETQNRMLVAVLDGKPNKVIAFEFNISISTVKSHMTEVLRKLGFAQRASLIARLGAWRTRDDLESRIRPHLAKFG